MDRRDHTEDWRTDINRHRFGHDVHRRQGFVDRDRFMGHDFRKDERHNTAVQFKVLAERKKIEAEGGKVLGERSGQRLNTQINREIRGRSITDEQRKDIIERYHLPETENGYLHMVDGQLLYEQDGAREVRNIEIVTENYRGSRGLGCTTGDSRGKRMWPEGGPGIVGKPKR